MSMMFTRPNAADGEVDCPVSIEWLVLWTYERQRADLVIDRGVGLYDAELAADGITTRKSSADGVYLLSTTGGRVDGGGKAKGDLHPDAELVHHTVGSMGREAQAVVMAYVRTGHPPDPMLGVEPVLRPKRGRDGKILRQRDIKRNAVSIVMEYYPAQSTIAMHRRAYEEWYAVMTHLCQLIRASGKLTAFKLTGVAAKPLDYQA